MFEWQSHRSSKTKASIAFLISTSSFIAMFTVVSLGYLWDLLSAVGTVTCHFLLCISTGIGRRYLVILCWNCCLWVLVIVDSFVITNLSLRVAASFVLLLLELCRFIYQAWLSLTPLFELTH